MRAVTFQAPGEVRIEEKAEPELTAADDAVVLVEASGICGSDLHIYYGRVPVEPGFTIGHEFVGTVLAVGDDVDRVGVGDRVLGCFHTACATCATTSRPRSGPSWVSATPPRSSPCRNCRWRRSSSWASPP